MDGGDSSQRAYASASARAGYHVRTHMLAYVVAVPLCFLAGALTIALLPDEYAEEVGSVIMLLGVVFCFAGYAGCIVGIYRNSEDWAFWAFVIDIVLLVAVFKFWHSTWRHALLGFFGLGLVGFGSLLGGDLNPGHWP